MRRLAVGWVLVAAALACTRQRGSAATDAAVLLPNGPRITDVGPRLISNTTSYVVAVVGTAIPPGATVLLDGKPMITQRVSATRLHVVVAPVELPPAVAEGRAVLSLQGGAGQVALGIANDRAFPAPENLAVSRDGKRAFVSVPQMDEVWCFDLADGHVTRVKVGDGPRGMATSVDAKGVEWLVVVHEHSAEIRLVAVADPAGPQRTLQTQRNMADVAVDDTRGEALVSNHRLNMVQAINLQTGAVTAQLLTGYGPRTVVPLGADGVAVANLLSEDISVSDRQGHESRVVAGPGTAIVGGRTEKFSPLIMGSKRPRDMVRDPRSGRLFVASAGPNIGPNPDRMEVTMNGGVAVVDPQRARMERHLALGGMGDGLALDATARVLFVALVSTGEVVAVDADALLKDDAHARKSELARLALAPGAHVPRIRPDQELGIKGRSGVSLHTGPRMLRLVDGGKTLVVLNRLGRTLDLVDVSKARKGQLVPLRSYAMPVLPTQKDRWAGEIVYYTDMGKTGMSCDACHPDGHTGGMLFTKGRPIQIYRATTNRGIRDTAPYFTPQRTPTLKDTAHQVLAHNRFENPPTSPLEERALAQYTSLVVVPPNPYLAANGAMPADVPLPNGAHGNPTRGLTLFEDQGGCSSQHCHPGPTYSADQDPQTRGRFHNVGTPQFLPLRPGMQDRRGALWPPPSLLGAWDQFPFLASGAGGLIVAPDGTLHTTGRFALGDVFTIKGTERHGLMNALTDQQKNDVLAFIMTL